MTTSEKKFTTKHMIVIGSILMAVLLLWGGIMQPDSFLMSFASVGPEHTALRAVILGSLIAILVSRPPRSFPFRMLLGAVSSLVLVVACVSMIDYQIGVLDAFLYLEVSIILAIEAIESQTVSVRFDKTSSAH